MSLVLDIAGVSLYDTAMVESAKKESRRVAKATGRPKIWFIGGFCLALLCFVGVEVALKYTSRPEFCGALCHEMGTAYRTWELSPHGANGHGVRVGCVDCHLPARERFFTHLVAKSYTGLKDVYKHLRGSAYNLEQARKGVLEQTPSGRCIHCHNSLLVKPASSASRKAHLASLDQPERPENRCVRCHEDAGHQRHASLYSPQARKGNRL